VRVAERDTEVAAYQALPLAEKFQPPAGVTPPALAVVMADGGHLQIRDCTAQPTAAPLPAAVGASVGTVAETSEEEKAPTIETTLQT